MSCYRAVVLQNRPELYLVHLEQVGAQPGEVPLLSAPRHGYGVEQSARTNIHPGQTATNRHVFELVLSASLDVFFRFIVWVRTGNPVLGSFPIDPRSL